MRIRTLVDRKSRYRFVPERTDQSAGTWSARRQIEYNVRSCDTESRARFAEHLKNSTLSAIRHTKYVTVKYVLLFFSVDTVVAVLFETIPRKATVWYWFEIVQKKADTDCTDDSKNYESPGRNHGRTIPGHWPMPSFTVSNVNLFHASSSPRPGRVLFTLLILTPIRSIGCMRCARAFRSSLLLLKVRVGRR